MSEGAGDRQDGVEKYPGLLRTRNVCLDQVRDLSVDIFQGFLGVMTRYVQDRGYINPGVYQRNFVLYLRYKV